METLNFLAGKTGYQKPNGTREFKYAQRYQFKKLIKAMLETENFCENLPLFFFFLRFDYRIRNYIIKCQGNKLTGSFTIQPITY